MEEISSRLDKISYSRELDETGTKVTISKDDFLWLVYGVHELNDKIEQLEVKIDRCPFCL